MMSHIVESCSLTKLNGGLSRLHSADEDAVSWLTNMVNDTHTRRRRRKYSFSIRIITVGYGRDKNISNSQSDLQGH